MVDKELGYIGWWSNISAEKSVQELEGQVSVPPLARRQLSCSNSAPVLTCVVGRRAISAIADICVGNYFVIILHASCNAYRLTIPSLPSFASRDRLVEGLT